MQQNLDLWYKSLLNSLNVTFTENDDGTMIASLKCQGSDSTDPLICDGKRLALISQQVLAKPNFDAYTYFHPLCEMALRGESPVLKQLQMLVLGRLTAVTNGLLINLMDIAADHDYHKHLNTSQHKVLTPLAEADAGALKTLTSIIGKCSLKGDNRVISLYIKRSGVWKDQKWSCLCNVSFNLLEELLKATDSVFGAKVRKKDIRLLIQAFQYLLPNSEKEGEYSFGSNSMSAPYLHSLLGAYNNVATQLNKVTSLFKKHLEDYEDYIIDLSWADGINNFAEWREVYPPMPSNTGPAEKNAGSSQNAKNGQFQLQNFNNEVNSSPVAPVGNSTTDQVADEGDFINAGGLRVAKNPLGSIGKPLELSPAAQLAASNASIQRTENGVDFKSVMANAGRVSTPINGLGFNGQQFNQQPMIQQPGFGNPSFSNNGGFGINQSPLTGGGFGGFRV